MIRFIETAPDALAPLIVKLLQEHKTIFLEVPSAKEAVTAYRALQHYSIQTEIFSPQFLLMERGEIDPAIQLKLYAIIEKKPDVLITTSLARKWKLPSAALSETWELKCGETVSITDLTRKLEKMGFRKTSLVQDSGEFTVKGDIVDISSSHEGMGYRIEFFDDEIEHIRLFSLQSQRNSKNQESATIFPQLFNRMLSPDWQKRLEKLLPDKSMRELMDLEELIEEGVGSPYDLFPLITGNLTIENFFEGAKVRFEQIRCDLSYQEALEKLTRERADRLQNGAFSPFAITEYFTTGKDKNDIEISSFFSTGENLEKFPVSHLKPDHKETEHPELLLRKHIHTHAIILITGEKEQGKYISLAEKHNILALPVDEIPRHVEPEHLYVIEGNSWLPPESYISLRNTKTVIISTDLFQKDKSKRLRYAYKEKPLPEEKGTFPALTLEKLHSGEYVVHYNYGIAIYEGMKRREDTDCLSLKYEYDDRIYLPVYNMHLVYKYRWEEGYFPKLSNLRTMNWLKIKDRVKNEIEKVAQRILELYAQRSLEKGQKFNIKGEMIEQFYNEFPYRETSDQLKSIKELEKDMQSEQVVDRLLCGDVGFGKTEVAMRGCVIAVANGKQAAILVPTTVLAFQHVQVFEERFKNFPIKIEMLSRFYSPAQQKKVAKEIKEGLVDIVIGTHRLLSKDIEFKNLGFLVVDEEHRFGVNHKERIKELKKGIATLSMTATPIPRTMQMSLLGIRDMSFIKTAPRERKHTKTHVLEFSHEIIKEAILYELERGGQIYFVHNRINSLEDIKGVLLSLIPDLKIAVAHGRMDENQLEQVMVDFVGKKYQLLLATTLIESGIDIPLVNTIIINRADMFGLAQLYQLRGRVGRWNREAHAYLMVPNLKTISKDAYSRLSVIKRFDKLGSGYQVAMEDLNIRGGGNILGISQSGKLKGVGYDFYLEMLKTRTDELKHGKIIETRDIEVKTHLSAYIPDTYIEDPEIRISFYRKLADMETAKDIIWMKELFAEMYGTLPEEVEHLFSITELRIEARHLGIASIEIEQDHITLNISADVVPKDMNKLFETVENLNGSFPSPHAIKIPGKKLSEFKKVIHHFSGLFST